jgi:hypothetical protein
MGVEYVKPFDNCPKAFELATETLESMSTVGPVTIQAPPEIPAS